MRKLLIIMSLLLWYSSYSQVKTFSAINVIDSLSVGGSPFIDTVIDISTYNGNLQVDTITANMLLLPNDTIIGENDTISINDISSFISAPQIWTKSGLFIYPTDISRWVGIGTTTPRSKFEVADHIVFNNNYSETAIGYNAGVPNGYRNTFIGSNSGKNIDYADNVALGSYTLYQGVHIRDNTAVGSSSGMNNTGDANTLLGYKTGYNNSGNNLIAIGHQAGYNNTADNNTFIGYESGLNNTTGKYNVFLGYRSGKDNVSGISNTFIGLGTGYINSSGIQNTYIGYYAGKSNITGGANTFVGNRAGYLNIGDNNVFIGNNAGYYEPGSDKLYIENSNSTTPLIYGDFANDSIKINASLNVTGSIISENSKSLIADYTISYSDFRLIVVATANDVNLTLPLRSSLAGLPYHAIEIIPITANGFKVRIQCQGTDSFPTGNTWIDLPQQKKYFNIGLHEHGFNLRQSLTIDASYYIDNLDAGDFSTPTMITWETEKRNTQNQIITWNDTSKFYVNTTGTYEVSAMFTFDSYGGSTWNVEAVLYVNGVLVPNTSLRTGNYGGEDGGMTGIPTLVDLQEGDYIEVQIDNNNLTGELLYATFNIKIEL